MAFSSFFIGTAHWTLERPIKERLKRVTQMLTGYLQRCFVRRMCVMVTKKLGKCEKVSTAGVKLVSRRNESFKR